MPDLPPSSPTDVSSSAPLAQAGEGGGGNSGVASESGASQSKRLALGSLVVLALVALVLVIAFFSFLRHWVAVHTGTLNESGPYYGFWSGFGSDLGEATLIGAVSVGVYTGVRKANCHTKGCWRIGHHPLEGTPYHLCRHHHPDVPTQGAAHSHILEQHRKYKEAQWEASQGLRNPSEGGTVRSGTSSPVRSPTADDRASTKT
jgi:hypothetical protein